MFPLITVGNYTAAEEPVVPTEQVEITIRIARPCPEGDMNREAWDRMIEDATDVASACQGCTSKTFEPMVDAMCNCIKEIGYVMSSDPEVHGDLSITVKDEMEQGCRGQVSRK